jgi:glucose/arabinose dehydrogenase
MSLVSRVASFALQLLIVTLAVLLGAEMAANIRIIPKALLHLPVIDFGPEDIRAVLTAYLIGCGAAFLANRLISGADPFDGARRLAKEIWALVVGIVAAALYLFFFTSIMFSPELLLDASLIALALHIVAWLVIGRVRKAPTPVLGFFGQLFGLLRSPWTWPILLFALSPIVVARQFTTDRDFANWVTALRVAANLSDDHPYEVVNALGETTFTTPIMAQFAPGDASHVYVLTRSGQLHRADYPTGANSTLLLDISKKVGYVEMENGALGFDLHPEFGKAGSPNAGYVYIYYTEYRPDRQINHLTRYDLRAGDPAAVQASATSLIEQRRNNDGYHNAGSVEFGPDGMLYLTVGEASALDSHQRVDVRLVGGVLRLDVDCRPGVSRPIARQPKDGRSANYCIPTDNPYAADPSALGEFWAHGLRNPFRMSFDPLTGQAWAGEVGSTTWEEVNRIERGANYQFPYVEGFTPQAGFTKPAVVIGRETPPVLTYKHTAYLRSVIGGIVYRGRQFPDLQGRYIFMDNYAGEVMTIPANATRVDSWTTIARVRDVAQRGATSIVEAPDGAILFTVMGDNDKPTGTVSRLVPADSEAAKSAKAAAAAKLAAAPAKISPAQARTLFNVNCARCHGASGQGDGPDHEQLGDYVPNFTDPNFHKWRSDAEILAAIRGGGQAVGRGPAMPPCEAEMVALKDYVRAFNGKAAAAE